MERTGFGYHSRREPAEPGFVFRREYRRVALLALTPASREFVRKACAWL